MKIIPEPAPNSRAVFIPKRGEVEYAFRGSGDLNYLCGNCDKVLMKDIVKGQIRNVVIKCPICGLFNDIP